jgi:hypothetical protein
LLDRGPCAGEFVQCDAVTMQVGCEAWRSMAPRPGPEPGVQGHLL